MTIKNICIWGDSITYGAWDEEGGWADLLRRFLHAKTITSFFKNDYWVYNLGIPGDTTRHLLARFAVECKAREPDAVIFAIGINDAKINSGISEKEFRKNLEALFTQAHIREAKLFCLGLTRVEEDKTAPFNEESSFTNECISRFDAIIKSVSRENRIPYIPMQDIGDAASLADGLHPNSAGHRKMFERVRDMLMAQGIF